MLPVFRIRSRIRVFAGSGSGIFFCRIRIRSRAPWIRIRIRSKASGSFWFLCSKNLIFWRLFLYLDERKEEKHKIFRFILFNVHIEHKNLRSYESISITRIRIRIRSFGKDPDPVSRVGKDPDPVDREGSGSDQKSSGSGTLVGRPCFLFILCFCVYICLLMNKIRLK